MFTRRYLLLALLCASSAFAQVPVPPAEDAPPPGTVTFPEIVAADPSEYGNYLFKLTYMGPEDKPVKTMVFGSATPRSVDLFLPYRRPGYPYGNDDLPEIVDFALSAAEIGAVIDKMSGDPVFTDGGDRPNPVLSLMIMADAGGPDQRVFETLVEYPDANRLVGETIAPNLDPDNLEAVKDIHYWSKNVGG